jgi:hypothetical protein
MKKVKNKQTPKSEHKFLQLHLKWIKEMKSDPNRGPVCKDPNFGASLYPPYPIDAWDMPGDRG